MEKSAVEPTPSGPVADEALVVRVRAGDRAAFELLMRRHNQRVFRVCRAVLKSDTDAEEAAQQAWFDAFTHLATFEGRSSIATWLSRIALHVSLARVRKTKREIALVDETLMADEKNPSPEDGAAAAEMRNVLERAIDDLPETLRVAFVLRDVDGLSTAEAAAALSIAEDAVKTRLHRARQALRERIDRDLGHAATSIFQFDGVRCDRMVARVMERIRP